MNRTAAAAQRRRTIAQRITRTHANIKTAAAAQMTRDEMRHLTSFTEWQRLSLFDDLDVQGILDAYHASNEWDGIESWLSEENEEVKAAISEWRAIHRRARKRIRTRALKLAAAALLLAACSGGGGFTDAGEHCAWCDAQIVTLQDGGGDVDAAAAADAAELTEPDAASPLDASSDAGEPDAAADAASPLDASSDAGEPDAAADASEPRGPVCSLGSAYESLCGVARCVDACRVCTSDGCGIVCCEDPRYPDGSYVCTCKGVEVMQ